ncbi:LysE/ArgO family amino acid transporter [Glaciimonas sp. PAMC28666]|uniref:LysE/ArgO family amino acid transporter n=1 Tax=Glaciimonas sp. PAMC28666 TaxID=2807626 RepID=UPI0019627C90|nr:LysE/ArgO family amino acid transporter [Glaciimonas sp. PAMC28666]QRX84326.1 amino acid transporter [Glaciimonas sp. PAMC28666]
METAAFLKGLGLGGGLIIAIGAQNAFILRQGLQRQYVLTSVLICGLCDSLLIALGVAGVGTLIANNPALFAFSKWGGAAFLCWCGIRSAIAAMKPAGLLTTTAPLAPPRYAAVIASALAFSLLNPHAYLDTVVLLGSVGGQEIGIGRVLFAAGAMLASLLWFLSLGLGARFAAPMFAKPNAWRILDGVIALVMWSIAASLLL